MYSYKADLNTPCTSTLHIFSTIFSDCCIFVCKATNSQRKWFLIAFEKCTGLVLHYVYPHMVFFQPPKFREKGSRFHMKQKIFFDRLQCKRMREKIYTSKKNESKYFQSPLLHSEWLHMAGRGDSVYNLSLIHI